MKYNVSLFVLMLLAISPLRAGTDCGCSKSGTFVSPLEGVSLDAGQDSVSPNAKYHVVITGAGPYDLIIKRTSDETVVYTASGIPGGAWGFSPDDDRFLYQYRVVGSTTVQYAYLIDLATLPGQQIWSNGGVTTTTSTIRFSPFGNYLMYSFVGLSPNHTLLSVVDARTGVTKHSNAFDFVPIPAAEPTTGPVDPPDTSNAEGLVYWGFSPDSSGRTFTYAFPSSSSQLEWIVANLQTHTTIVSTSISNISAYWQFSPCGDVIGIVTQTSPTLIGATLYRTISAQSALYSSSTIGFADPVELKTTNSSHIFSVGGTDYVMSSNTANSVCEITPISLKLAPHTLQGGLTSVGTVVLSTFADAGGKAVTLTSSNPGVASVPPSVVVAAGDTSATFNVTTTEVGSVDSSVISASSDGTTKRDTLKILPLSLASMTFSSNGAWGGDSLTGTVTLTGQAGAGGKVVTLSNSNTSHASIPPFVTVSAGQTSQTFIMHTSPVMILDSATVSASAGGVMKSKTLPILAFPAIAMQRDSIVGGIPAAITADVPVPAPKFLSISFQSSADTVALPASPAGFGQGQTHTSFYVQTFGVDADVTVTITATNAPFPTSTILHVLAAHLNSFTSIPDEGCVVGEKNGFSKKFIAGKPVAFYMLLDGVAPANGASIHLLSDKPGVIAVPDSTIIPPRAAEHTVVVTSSAAISSPEQVVITASYRTVTIRDTVTIVPTPHYAFVDLGDSVDLASRAVAINNAGAILGTYTSTDYRDHPYLLVNNIKQLLGNPPGFAYPQANGLNDSGTVVGFVYRDTLDFSKHAVVWKNEVPSLLPGIAGYAHSGAYAVNNSGLIVGAVDHYGTVLTQPEAVLWQDTTVTDLGLLPNDIYSYATDINSAGQVVGNSLRDSPHDPFPRTSSFIWENPDISAVIFGQNEANAINDAGVIAGSHLNQLGWYTYDWSTDDRQDYQNLPPFYESKAQDINSSGVVVGSTWMYDEETRSTAFVFTGGYSFDLNCLTTLPSDYVLQSASSINNAGQIVGVLRKVGSSTTVERAFLLNPLSSTAVGEPRKHVAALPVRYELLQNFPNPFNPATTIRYGLPARSRVLLTVYNIIGQEISRLVDATQDAGYYSVVFDASRLPSGVYFYRLNAGATTSVKKLMLIK